MEDTPLSIPRPARWDVPFGPEMTEADVDRLLEVPPFSRIDPKCFPAKIPLKGILANDARLVRYLPGDIVVREGDWGNSAYFILTGAVRVEIEPPESSIPRTVLGRSEPHRKSFFEALSQWWSNSKLPEARDPSRYRFDPRVAARGRGDEITMYLQDLPVVLDHYKTARLTPGQIFGELSALGRTPRTATVFAEEETEILEIRWQGLRDLMRRDDELKNHIDSVFRERSLKAFLQNSPIFRHLSFEEIDEVAAQTEFEMFGRYDAPGSFKKLAAAEAAKGLENEPIIAEEGHYPNGVILIRSGVARLSERLGQGHRTVSYLVPGQAFGFQEIAQNWRAGTQTPFRYSLRAIGNVGAVLVPAAVIERFVLERVDVGQLPIAAALPAAAGLPDRGSGGVGQAPGSAALAGGASGPGVDSGLLEFLLENRYVNGTETMMIDLDRCTRCDDCVRACAAAHDNNPRFLRHGQTYGHLMVARACMHCMDPVCMIECPTGAIHRDVVSGNVLINDRTCIGCSACASNCPYDAIQMVEIRDARGRFILDEQKNEPIVKATKCDLCVDQLGGPACQRACPHEALVRMDMRKLDSYADWLRR